MNKLTLTALASLLAVAAFSDTVQDIKGGTDLAIRCVGGSYSVTGAGISGSGSLPPSILVHVAKTATGLVAIIPTGTLFKATGISTNLTFTGTADATTEGIDWTVTDPGLLGQTITIPVNGVPISVTVNPASDTAHPGVGGNIFTVGTHVVTPVLDPFDVTYRGTSLLSDFSQTSSITINGVTEGVIPVSIVISPQLSGIGGEKVTQFVNHVLLSTPTVVSGQTYTGTVYLESAVTANTTVSLASNLAPVGSVVVPAGQSHASFSFTVGAVYSTTASYIHAIAFGTTADEALTALPLMSSITCDTAIPVSGAPVQFTVHLNANAPTGGLVVEVRSDDQNLPLPSTVTVPAGANHVTFTATPSVVSSSSSLTGITETYVTALYAGTTVRAAVVLH